MNQPELNRQPDPQGHCLPTEHPDEPTSAPFGRIVSSAPWTADVACGQASPQNISKSHTSGEVLLDGKDVSYESSATIHRHSLDGFDWGRQTAGAAQLALALLAEVVKPQEALELRFQFAAEVIARLPKERSALSLSRLEILSWVNSVKKKEVCNGTPQ